ncbi:MAG: GNAT family protein [Campylobacterota bacterium]|nr:GNAT family protein [Campylobacterota bacterium]
MRLSNENITIELLNLDNCDFKSYMKWMNNWDIVKYTSSKFRVYDIESLHNYINDMNNSKNDYLFGIFYKNKHIGNLKIGSINYINRNCYLGLIIGKKKYFGKGIATKSISLGVEFAFNYLGLFKVKSGMYECNQSSYKAFLNNDFIEIGRYKKDFLFNSKRYDVILLEKINKTIEN